MREKTPWTPGTEIFFSNKVKGKKNVFGTYENKYRVGVEPEIGRPEARLVATTPLIPCPDDPLKITSDPQKPLGDPNHWRTDYQFVNSVKYISCPKLR